MGKDCQCLQLQAQSVWLLGSEDERITFFETSGTTRLESPGTLLSDLISHYF
jgi:hypothetical protein